MKFTPTQCLAVEKAIHWYYNVSHTRNIFVIAGYAGTGKTTIVKQIIRMLGMAKYNVLYAALTGKATSVLRLKGNLAHTIHKTFYSIYKYNGRIFFKLKNRIPSVIKLIVVDEVGMINDKMLEEILSFGVPVIALGDPGQLPPIFGKNNYVLNADAFLTEVMRTNDTTGILNYATMAREGKPLPYGKIGNSQVVPLDSIDKMTSYDTVLCYRNQTRKYLNASMRRELGIKTVYPRKGEKLICLKNNYSHEIEIDDIQIFLVNGLNCIAISDTYERSSADPHVELHYKPDFMIRDDPHFHTKCDRLLFDMYKDLSAKKVFIPEDEGGEDYNDMASIDFGYALTVHKSQGSEWSNVLVIDEYKGPQEQYNKWLYTAITRASNRVTIAS